MSSASRGVAASEQPAAAVTAAGRSSAAASRSGATANKSATAAALLSSLFPGLGQGYLGRRRAAVVFAVPALLLLALIGYQLRDGTTLAFERLLDPVVAGGLLAAVVVSGVWRAAAVVNAALAGQRTRFTGVMTAALLAIILASHALGASFAGDILTADNELFSGDPLDEIAAVALQATADPLGEPAPTAAPAGSSSESPFGSPLASPAGSPDYGDVYYDEPDDPMGDIVAGGPAFADPARLRGVDEGLLNVLLVGIDWKAGRDHALTDTMIVVSVNRDTGDVFMFSFPRDTARFPVYTGGTFSGRLNSFANYARHHPNTFPDGGLRSLADEIGYLLGIPIDYYASVNIPGFAGVVDALGGVTIYNERPIVDERFGFFMDVGRQRLDGTTALQWVRSRHGQGNNDFERARRQQQMLVALRREILKPIHLLHLPRIVRALSRVVSTDFPPSEIDEMLRLADRVSGQPTDSWVFGWPGWADHPPTYETGGRWIITLDLDRIARLSVRLFGDRSLYSN